MPDFFLYEMPLKASLFLRTTVLGEAKPSFVYEPEQKSAEGRFEGQAGLGIVGPSYQWVNKCHNFVRNHRRLTDLHSAIMMKFFLYEMPPNVSLAFRSLRIAPIISVGKQISKLCAK